MKKKIRLWLIGISATGAACLAAFLLIWNGIILLNDPDGYEIRGVDVSHYQGDIDWQVLAAQDIDFAFIKATEGSSYIDDRFEYNLSEAKKTDLRVGAYHFFSFDSAGITQAENFISNVEAFEGMLPPVVDFEYYGDKKSSPPEKEAVLKELDALLSALESHYGKRPIIYVTKECYERYLAGGYEGYDIWYREVIFSPEALPDGREWVFWQYTNRERLDGYKGEEEFIDMNVFNGRMEEWESYGR